MKRREFAQRKMPKFIPIRPFIDCVVRRHRCLRCQSFAQPSPIANSININQKPIIEFFPLLFLPLSSRSLAS